LKLATRQEYQRIAKELSIIDDVVMRELNSADIVKIREAKLKTRNLTVANKTLALLSVLFSYAIERNYANDNPVRHVKKVKRPSNLPRKNRPWKLEEIDAVLSSAPASIRLPILIARWTGLRQGDVLALLNADYDGKVIRCRTAKRDVSVVIPVSETLASYLDARISTRSPTICNNSRGQSWTRDGFKTSLFKLIRNLEEEGAVGKGLTFHGLRHTMATELSELGYDNRTIADMLGQKSEGMAAHYSRDANLINKLAPAISRMEEREKDRRAVSNFPEKVSN
jgi:integrase